MMVLVVLAGMASALLVPLAWAVASAPAGAAGSGQYSPPEWWPLRGQKLVGCARNSPGAICGGNYHPVWAIDIESAEGQPIYASGAGLASVNSDITGCTGYGKSVVVNHNGAKSLYGHMSAFSSALNASPGGVWVDENTIIGYVGHTGNVSNCSYNHLHYEESTSGSWWTGATDPGSFKACQGTTLVTYPQAWGATSWSGLAAHTYTARHDGPTCGALTEGSFIAYGGHVYRIAGGAPIYIASWNDVGGPKDATPVTAEQFAALRAYPSDGTFVGAGGYVFRFAGGSPIYVASWNDVGGPQSVIEVSLSTLNNGDGPVPYNHVRRYPADGTFVGAGGYVFRFAGGSPIYVASWNDVGGSQPSTAVSLSTLNNGDGAAPYNHVHKYPADGTFVGAGGYVFRFAGGSPIYVASWNDVGGSQPSTAVSISTLNNGDGAAPYNHVHKYPADGTFVSAGGPVYKFAGGAPIYVSSWANVGGSQPATAVSASTLNNGDGAVPYNHVHKYPADGTVLIGLPGTQRYRVHAGAAVPLASAPAGVGVDGVAIANAGGPVPWSHLLKVGTGFHSVVPTRVLDSRTTTGGWSGALVAGTPRSLTVTGAGIPTNATAVVMNVTVTAGTAGSFLTAYPTGGAIPNASNINFAAGQTLPNLVTVGVASGGKVSFANAAGAVHVVADVVGYYDDGLTPGDQYNAVAPTRLLDSRTATGSWSAKLGPGSASTKDLQVTGGAVPAGAKAVTMNVTVTDGDTASFLQAWPAGAARPTSSNVNFAAGQTTANLVTVQIGTGGKVSFFNAAGSVHVIADVVGYFDPAEGGSRFHSVTPTRLLDDRNGTGLSGPWAGNQSRSFAVGGTPAIPTSATSVILNATVTNASTGSFITLYADLTAKPTASNLNFGPGETRANLSVVRTGTNGKVAVYNAAGTVDIIADTVGYFAPS